MSAVRMRSMVDARRAELRAALDLLDACAAEYGGTDPTYGHAGSLSAALRHVHAAGVAIGAWADSDDGAVR